MTYPGLGDYQDAIQNPHIVFNDPDLRSAKVEIRPNGLPWPRTGGFAVTYKLYSPARAWAVRCFHRETPELDLRYRDISAFLQTITPPRFVDFVYRSEEILVRGKRYPIVKMDWIQGVSLESFVANNRTNAHALEKVTVELRDTIRVLERNGASHGDLQHGNILVGQAGVTIIDYDGMYVPGIAVTNSYEVGHVNYQSPFRAGSDYGPWMDRFAGIVICLSLEALKEDPTLWDRYNAGDNLLFTRKDFVDPDNSEIFKELAASEKFKRRIDHLASLCRTPLAQLPSVDQFLAESAVARTSVREAAPTITHARLHQYDIISAKERQELLGRVGDMVQVVGEIVNVSIHRSRIGQPYAFIDFGDWKYQHFRLTIWSSTLAQFRDTGIDINSLKGTWVTAIGMIEEWKQTPQIIIEEPREIRELGGGETQAKRLLGENQREVTLPAPESPKPSTRNLEILERVRRSVNSGQAAVHPPAAASTAVSPPVPKTEPTRNQETIERIWNRQSNDVSTKATNQNAQVVATNAGSNTHLTPAGRIPVIPKPQTPAPRVIPGHHPPPLSNRTILIALFVIIILAYLLFD